MLIFESLTDMLGSNWTPSKNNLKFNIFDFICIVQVRKQGIYRFPNKSEKIQCEKFKKTLMKNVQNNFSSVSAQILQFLTHTLSFEDRI